jgi:hypothetical protein
LVLREEKLDPVPQSKKLKKYLGGVSDQALCVGEGDITGSGSVTLIVGNDFHLSMLLVKIC